MVTTLRLTLKLYRVEIAAVLLVAFALPPDLAPEVSAAIRSPGYGRLAAASAAVVAGKVRCPAALATFFVVS